MSKKEIASDIDLYKKALVGGNYVSQNDFDLAVQYAKENDSSVLDYLLKQEIVNSDIVGQAVAEHLGVKYADLNSHTPSFDQISKIPEKIARKYRVVLFSIDKNSVVVSTDKPKSKNAKTELEELFKNKKIELAYSLSEDVDNILVKYRKPLDTRFAKIINDSEKIAPEIIDEIIDDALIFRSSDIHFEPRKKDVYVRFRVDGILREAGKIPKKYYENIINRIKIQSKLRIDDHFSAQDGSMRMKRSDQAVDLRISIVPTLNGEKIVIRVLAEYVKGFNFGDLGLSIEDQQIVEEASKKPFGMVLVTGPTGSGKTTTLYSILQILNNPEVNITTIEDPVEYQLVGLNQIQVNKQTDLTFAKGLRSIVRQDPDVILVGEIRDNETAEIAVNAALTGHLLFSTFHSNDAATAIPRLLDMKVEPFILASTLELIIAQRLMRKTCEKCRSSVITEKKIIKQVYPGAEAFFDEGKVTLYEGQGCDSCGQTGYYGRSAIFEIIKITDQMKELVLENPSSDNIWELARSQGSKTLFEDGIEKVKAGVTTLEELYRVAAPPSKE